jgi:DNA-binding CsgD family transcriptional regulator
MAKKKKAADPVTDAKPQIVTLPADLSAIALTARDKVTAYLTPTERRVFDLMGDCKANAQIAAALGISSKTLDIHRANVKRKLNLSVPEVVRAALLMRLLA